MEDIKRTVIDVLDQVKGIILVIDGKATVVVVGDDNKYGIVVDKGGDAYESKLIEELPLGTLLKICEIGLLRATALQQANPEEWS